MRPLLTAAFCMFLGGLAVAQPASRPESQPGGGPIAPPVRAARADPFSPPKAVPPAASPARAPGEPGRPVAAAGARPAAPVLPVLEGVIVRGKGVLACFRSGGSCVVVELGARIGDGGAFQFVAWQDEAAVLRDAAGTLHQVRLGFRAAPGQPAPSPAGAPAGAAPVSGGSSAPFYPAGAPGD